MGTLETSGRRKTGRRNITSMVLGAVSVVGLLGIAVVAPNVIGAMDKLGLLPARRQGEIINRSRDRLLAAGYLKREGNYLRLTEKGEARLRLLEAKEASTRPQKRWDGKWRVLIFDIPEYRRGMRDKLRQALTSVGFIRLQNSVWIYPYDCEDLVALLKADLKIGEDMLYLIVEEMEGSERLKRQFAIH